MVSWEREYGPQIVRLEDLIKEASKGNLTGTSWLNQPNMAGRLKVPETSSNSAVNHWPSKAEAVGFKSILRLPKATSE